MAEAWLSHQTKTQAQAAAGDGRARSLDRVKRGHRTTKRCIDPTETHRALRALIRRQQEELDALNAEVESRVAEVRRLQLIEHEMRTAYIRYSQAWKAGQQAVADAAPVPAPYDPTGGAEPAAPESCLGLLARVAIEQGPPGPDFETGRGAKRSRDS